MSRSITVSPAYGRDYKSSAAALADWEDNKDFLVEAVWPSCPTGRYVNKSDVIRIIPDAEVRIRFKRKTEVVIVP